MANITRDKATGLERMIVVTDLARAEIFMHGAQVARFQPTSVDHPILWMSKSSLFRPDKPIRGGVPICFPWFGPKADDPKAPAHGFARVSEFVRSDVTPHPDDSVTITLLLQSGKQLHPRWPYRFQARHAVTVGRTLKMEFAVTNVDESAFQFEAALHTYLVVGDIRQTEVRGLEGATYLDRLKPGERFTQDDRAIEFSAETDRTYVNTEEDVTVIDSVLKRKIVNRKSGSRSTVVWNPWIDKARAMADFGNDEWRGMLCIETANAADNAITLAPGATHTMSAEIAALAL